LVVLVEFETLQDRVRIGFRPKLDTFAKINRCSRIILLSLSMFTFCDGVSCCSLYSLPAGLFLPRQSRSRSPSSSKAKASPSEQVTCLIFLRFLQESLARRNWSGCVCTTNRCTSTGAYQPCIFFQQPEDCDWMVRRGTAADCYRWPCLACAPTGRSCRCFHILHYRCLLTQLHKRQTNRFVLVGKEFNYRIVDRGMIMIMV